MDITPLVTEVGLMFVIDFLRYFLVALFFYGLFYWVLKNSAIFTRTGPRVPTNKQMKREFYRSSIAVAVFSFSTVATYLLYEAGQLRLYENIAEMGTLYFLFSIGITIVLHDTYFYFTHRLLHHPKIYKFGHAVHHQSVSPSPWATYSFDTAEAFIQSLFPLLILPFIPMHELAFLAFLTFMIIFSVIGHLGYEIYPKNWIELPILKYKTTVTHHALHHTAFNNNFGLYFTFWDKLLGTEHPEYAKIFRNNAVASYRRQRIST